MILVFDLSTILSGCTRDWVDFSNHAPCYLPEVVLQELNFLTQRAITPKEEKIAREFLRFFPDSGWEITSTMSAHPALTPKEADNISKNARLSLAIAESVYDLALRRSEEIVVFVTSEGNLLRQLNQTQQPNLAIIPTSQLKQWVRTGEMPLIVKETMINLSNQDNNQGDRNGKKVVKLKSIDQFSSPKNNRVNAQTPRVKSEDSLFNTIKYSAIALLSLTITIGVAWYFVAPESFSQTWERMGFPPLEKKNK